VSLIGVQDIPSVRRSASYLFAIKEVMWPQVTAPDPHSQGFLQLGLFQGADQDDKKRDSIERLAEFLGRETIDRIQSAPGFDAHGKPMGIQDTNSFTVITFYSRGGSQYLFEDDRGRKTAISTSPSGRWTSRALWEQFGAGPADNVEALDYPYLMSHSDVIICGDVIKKEEQKAVFSRGSDSEGVCYVFPTRYLKGHTAEVQVEVTDEPPFPHHAVSTVRVGWYRPTWLPKCPCALYDNNIWFLHLFPGATNNYSLVGTLDISAEQSISNALRNMK
jgi:hypothetical protein